MINGKSKKLGYFINKEDAIKARKEAEIKYFGDFRSREPEKEKSICWLGVIPEGMKDEMRYPTEEEIDKFRMHIAFSIRESRLHKMFGYYCKSFPDENRVDFPDL